MLNGELFSAISGVNDFIWSYPAVFLILFCGIYFSCKLRFFQVRRLWPTVKATFLPSGEKKQEGISPFEALCTALGGTIGVGNTIGVGMAISIGGSGALFWMWVAATIGMAVKYAEIFLAVKYRSPDDKSGGAFFYIERGMKSKTLAKVFAVSCLMVAFTMGNMAQTNAFSESVRSVFDLPAWLLGAVAFLILLSVLKGGIKRVGRMSAFFVPLMTFGFFLLCFFAITKKLDRLPEAVLSVFKNAFSMSAAAGGASGYVFMRALRQGFSKGIFSNEAGLGSAPLVHSSTGVADPKKAGLWGVTEVFIDTHVVCTLTALVVILYPPAQVGGRAVFSSFSMAFGQFGEALLGIFIAYFALASTISWGYYGERAGDYLFKRNNKKLYYLIYCIAAFGGAIINTEKIFSVCELFNAFMLFPNIISLIYLRKNIEYPSID